MIYLFVLICLAVFILLLVGYTLHLRKTRGEVNANFILLAFFWPLSILAVIFLSPLILLVLFLTSIEKIIKRMVSVKV